MRRRAPGQRSVCPATSRRRAARSPRCSCGRQRSDRRGTPPPRCRPSSFVGARAEIDVARQPLDLVRGTSPEASAASKASNRTAAAVRRSSGRPRSCRRCGTGGTRRRPTRAGRPGAPRSRARRCATRAGASPDKRPRRAPRGRRASAARHLSAASQRWVRSRPPRPRARTKPFHSLKRARVPGIAPVSRPSAL